MPIQRYKLTIAYRGTAYHGWQRQAMPSNWKGAMPPEGHGLPTIQEVVSRAMGLVVRHPVELVGSSRTDSGVHAKGQVAHFDSDQTQIPPEGMRQSVNHKLPDDILIRAIEPVGPEFHAIRSTLRKRYQYAIWNAIDRPPLFGELAWHRWQPLDVERMRDAALHIIGERDFASFCRPGHARETTVRTIHSCDISQRGPRLIIGIEGNGFLWHMVRIIVGTLVDLSLRRLPPETVRTMLSARDRRAAGPTAPPCGLYLQWIQSF
jgi:tRNA pseudouridine38-40 synthase